MKMIKSIILCIFLSVITLGIATLFAFIFGTVKFLKGLDKLQRKLFDLEQVVMKKTQLQIKAVEQLEIDLATNQQSMLCKRCNYSDIPASNSQL